MVNAQFRQPFAAWWGDGTTSSSDGQNFKAGANVSKLLDGKAKIGGKEDREIESALRDLWDIDGEDGAYINGEFYDLPDGQAIRDLFLLADQSR